MIRVAHKTSFLPLVASIVALSMVMGACGQELPPGEAEPAEPVDDNRAINLEEHFAGQTVRIQVGFSPGGTHDLYSRLLADPLSKHLPGNPRIEVINTPGAGGQRGVEATMRAEPDGLTIGLVATRFYKFDLIGEDIPGFSLDTLQVIGSPTFGPSERQWNVRCDVASSWEEVLELGRPLTSGGTSPGSIANLGPEFVDLIGGPIDVVFGYGGSAEVLAALDRGEIDATGFGSQSDVERQYPEWITRNTICPVFWWEERPDEDYLASLGAADIPNLLDVVEPTEAQRQVFEATININGLSRTYVLPPDTPEEIHQAWVEAFEATVQDEDFINATIAAGEDPPNLGMADQVMEVVNEARKLDREQLELFAILAGQE